MNLEVVTRTMVSSPRRSRSTSSRSSPREGRSIRRPAPEANIKRRSLTTGRPRRGRRRRRRLHRGRRQKTRQAERRLDVTLMSSETQVRRWTVVSEVYESLLRRRKLREEFQGQLDSSL